MRKQNKLLMGALMVTALMSFAASAASITNTVGGFGFPANASGQAYLLTAKTLDLSATTVALSNSVAMINIPAGSRVLGVQYKVTTSTSTNNITTFDVGDDANASGWASNVASTNGAGWQASAFSATCGTNGGALTVTGYSAGKFYAADDTIDLRFDGTPGTIGAVDMSAIVIRAVK